MIKNVTFYTALLLGVLLSSQVIATPKKQLLAGWDKHNAASQQTIDHVQWQLLLDKYLRSVGNETRFNYSAVTTSDKKLLRSYLNKLQTINPLMLNRKEQFAYWVNLYNAATVNLILQHYPISSIKDIGSFLSSPWDKKIVTINAKKISLNNIEHGILRPIYQDQRIHYVVNCASIGCPNLYAQALTANNQYKVLQQAAKIFVNHPRAVSFDKRGELILSSIYDWYADDFGENQSARLHSILTYANPQLKKRLQAYSGKINYQYDWRLNQL